MAAVEKQSARLLTKVVKNGKHIENNNYVFKEKAGKKQKDHINSVAYFASGISAILCYLNSVHGDFVHDDVMAIKTNLDVRSYTPISQIFKNDFWGKPMIDSTSHKSYRPLCVLTFRLNYILGGLDPFGFHLVNIFLHSLATLLFCYICDTLVFKRRWPTLVAGVIFAVHPIHTEAVSGIVGRADVLACVLVLMSFIAYVRSIDQKSHFCCPKIQSPVLFVFSLLLAVCAMFTKEHGITVLGVCLLYDICIISQATFKSILAQKWFRRDDLPLVKRCGAIIFTLVLCLCLRAWVMDGQLPSFSEQDNPASYSPYLLTRILTYSYLYAFNTYLLLFPSLLSFDWQMHSIPLVENLVDIRNIASLMFYMTLCGVVYYVTFKAKHSDQNTVFCSLCFLVIPFLPASNIFLRVGFVIAERILYIPSIGYIILLVHGLDKLTSKLKTQTSSIQWITVLLCLCLAARTVIRNQVWRSRESLFRSGLQVLPHNAKMHYNYANYLKDTGQKETAIYHYGETISTIVICDMAIMRRYPKLW